MNEIYCGSQIPVNTVSEWKQLPELFSQKRCFQKFRNIHRKTSVLESLFTKIGVLQACNFIKKRPQRNCFPLDIAKSLRAAILENCSSICVANLLHAVWFSNPLGYQVSRLGEKLWLVGQVLYFMEEPRSSNPQKHKKIKGNEKQFSLIIRILVAQTCS